MNHATVRVDDAEMKRTLQDALPQVSGLCRIREIAILPMSALPLNNELIITLLPFFVK